MTAPFWVSAFLDLAPDDHDRALAFWVGVTGYAVSEPRGDAEEFRTLVPHRGSPHLKVQRLAAGPSRIHLDLHVDDPRTAADEAVARGATELAAPYDEEYVVLRSPGGLTFCLVSHPATEPAPPVAWEGGRSVVDQVCLDISPAAYDEECAFWAATTARSLTASASRPEFRVLEALPRQRPRVLLQRLDDDQPHVSAHLDVACDDRTAEVARHEELGARAIAQHTWWTVLMDPTGIRYCVTDRDPDGGALG